MSESRQNTQENMHPGWLIPLSVLAGLMATGPLAGFMLAQRNKKSLGWAVGLAGLIVGAAVWWGMVLWNTQWAKVGLALFGFNLAAGLGLWRLVAELSPKEPEDAESSQQEGSMDPERGGFRHVLTGIVGGGMVAGILGAVGAMLYLLSADALLSTWFPVTFADDYAMGRLVFSGLCLMAAGGIAGGIGGRLRPQTTPWELVTGCMVLVFVYLSWAVAAEITIALPGFQAGAVTGKGWEDIMGSMVLGELCIGILWATFWAIHITAVKPWKHRLHRTAVLLGFNVAAAITLAISFGYAAETYLAMGLHMERRAQISKALWCYERGMKKMPEKHIASFLQYRAALIYHKLGKDELAEKGFERLVAKYNSSGVLVKKASRFLDNMRRSSGEPRVVLPGVETRTEYKSAYCVPNSLALTMRYWGADIDAREIGKEITGLSGGTFAVNQAWFAIQRGFRHDFLPMASLDDIKRCIDAGFPVMVYVPSHVLVIFGYDEALGTFVTYDTATSDLWAEYIQRDFIKAWKRRATTVVLAYPPEQEGQLPPDIAERLQALSDNYLHYQLHYLDAPRNVPSVPHLMAAAGQTGEFFFPVTTMYSVFPGLRQELVDQFDSDVVINGIQQYFGEDFDEGEHLYGQYHDERRVDKDSDLHRSINFLIGNQRFDMVDSLVTCIDDEGQVSSDLLGYAGMVDLVWGDYDQGLDRIRRAIGDDYVRDWNFYLGLARKNEGNQRDSIRLLAQALHHSSRASSRARRSSMPLVDSNLDVRIHLDEFGFPALAQANKILVQMDDLGQSREDLMSSWERWHHFMPFDAPVAYTLANLYQEDLEGLDADKDAAEIFKLNNKLKLAKQRALRFDLESFRTTE